VIEYKGINWYYYQGALLPRVPPHYEINLTSKEQKELLKKSKALFLRYTNEWDRDGGEFWYVIKDKEENMSGYKSKVRNQIKKGLKNCSVRKVTKKIITDSGYEVYIEAFENYSSTSNPINIELFRKSILNSSDDYWAVYDNEDRMIAYAQNLLLDRSCNYGSMKFYPKYLNLYPSYALIYYMTEYYINQNNFSYVSDGARSISHDTNIQEFLIKKFQFRKAYCRLNIVYRWDIGLFVIFLYPFKSIISKINHNFFKKISVLLKQEEIQRSYE